MNDVYILIVNWNGWCDTIECLETVFRIMDSNYKVIVCDNGSDDNSIDYIKAWAENRLNALPTPSIALRSLSYPPIAKPCAYVEYEKEEAEAGGSAEDSDVRLILIRGVSNLGFAGGNNVGLRYALSRNDFDYVWLLNNDTVIRPEALSKMIARMKESPAVGMCGSKLLHYNAPDKVQALGGGYYCRWIGLPWHLGRLKKATDPTNTDKVEKWMNYVVGASVLVSRQFLLDVGLMCEDYFLYFEEADWAIRAKGRYSLAYAPDSVVYHKIGKSIGTSSNPKNKSMICDYYNVRNRLLFTRRFFPYALPTVHLVLAGTLLTRLFLGKLDRFMMLIKLIFKTRTAFPHVLEKG